MRKNLLLLIFILGGLTPFSALSGIEPGKEKNNKADEYLNNQAAYFLENKGQMTDADDKPIPFVMFRLATPGMNAFVTEKGLTYVFFKLEEKFVEEPGQQGKKEIFEIEKAWVNLHLQGASIKKENIIKQQETAEHFNYFYPHCPGGIYEVKGYQKLTIKNVYPGIDWILYSSTKTGMKYDFIVHPGADANQIKLIYESANALTLHKSGNLEIKTVLGTLTEQAPVSYIRESNQPVVSSFNKKIIDRNHVEITYKISTGQHSSTLVIDPQQVWGTLFSGTSDQGGATSMETDNNNNLFITGYTNGLGTGFPLMNAGTYYDNTITSVYDLFILKFSNTGALLWGTYYGGSGNERALYEFPFITTDGTGNVFVTGQTTSTDFPVQDAGTYYDSTYTASGQYNAFILKFDNSGNRLWATYFGNSGPSFPGGTVAISASTDLQGNLFIAGYTNSTSGFPLQPFGTAYFDNSNNGANDIFISRFDNAGNLIWSTYYGGSSTEYAYGIVADSAGSIFVTGYTTSANFPTQNSGTYFDNLVGGGEDAVMIKFDNSGNLLWSTYFGGSATGERAISIGCDASQNIFIYGPTYSADFPLLNAGTYFDSIVNNEDMFISKFDNAGNLIWSTYFGGNSNPIGAWDFWEADGLTINECGNVYIAYDNNAGDDPLHDPGCGSYMDSSAYLMLVEFSNAGDLLWSTRIGAGAGGGALRFVIEADHNNAVYYAHEYNAPSAAPGVPFMFLPGAYNNTTFGPATTTNHDDFLLKFVPIPLSVSVSGTNDTCGCTGTATAIPTCGTPPFTYLWSNAQTTQTITGLCAGNYSVIVTDNYCVSIPDTEFVTITGSSSMTAALASTPTSCIGNTGTSTVNPSGGTPPYTYLWSNGQTTQTATGLGAGIYTVTVTDSNGCAQYFIDTVASPAIPVANVNSSANPLCNGDTTGIATAGATGGTVPYTYLWNNGQTSDTATGLGAGMYIVTVTDSNGCSGTDTVIITEPAALVLSTVSTQAGCTANDGTATATASDGTPGYTYLWNNGQTAAVATGLGAGTYTVTVTDANGCSITATATIVATAGPTAGAGPDVTISPGNSVTLTATGGGSYLWNTGDTTASIIVSPIVDTEYCVIVTDTNQCTDTACVKVFVDDAVPCPTNESLAVPNAFSPNNDGQNDVFCLEGWNVCIQDFIVHIYDRWGEEVFQSTNSEFCWDGIYKSKPLDAAVFVYYIEAELTTSEEIFRKGNISLIR